MIDQPEVRAGPDISSFAQKYWGIKWNQKFFTSVMEGGMDIMMEKLMTEMAIISGTDKLAKKATH